MLVVIFVSTALVSGVTFGYFVSSEVQKRQRRREQRSVLEQTPTALLEDELSKRGTTQNSPFR